MNYAVLWANTSNIGDDIQTLAAIMCLKESGIYNYNFVNRENLKNYIGNEVVLIMNGWFMHDITQFPPSNKIRPVFISFNCNKESLIKNNIDYLRKFQPIGCRDIHTIKLLKKYGIKGYFSGCLTLCFHEFKIKTDETYIVDVNSNCDYIPNVNVDLSNYGYANVIEHEIREKSIINAPRERIKIANDLLDKYSRAKLVITSRLHCVLPCRAYNTNVIFVHKNYKKDPRFSGLEKYINGDSENINIAKSTIDRSIILDIKKRIYENFYHSIKNI